MTSPKELQTEWAELFDRHERARMTRAKIVPAEWIEVARVTGRYSSDFIIRAAETGADRDVVLAIAEVCGANVNALRRDNLTVPAEEIRRVPSELRPAEPGIPGQLYGVTSERLSEIARRMPTYVIGENVPRHMRSQRLAERCSAALRIHDAGITADIADRYGCSDDWDRARICVQDDVNPADAQAWAPLYPYAFTRLAAGGWSPADVAGMASRDVDALANWARCGATPATLAAWQAVTDDPMTASVFTLRKIEPADAARWLALVTDKRDVHRVVSDGRFTLEQAEAAHAAGLAINDATVDHIANVSPDEIAGWCRVFNVNTVSGSTLRLWKATGLTPDQAAPWIEARAELGRYKIKALELAHVAAHITPADMLPQTHPVCIATARDLGIPLDKVPTMEAAATAYRRRRKQVPWV